MPLITIINNNKVFQSVPTLSATQYSAGDSLGGLIIIDANAFPDGGAAYLEALTLVDKQAANTQIDVIIFNDNPSSSTITDNVAVSIASVDLDKIIGFESVTASEYIALNTQSVAHTNAFSIPLLPVTTSRTLYACLIERGTPTRADGDLILSFQIVWLGK